jgi:hypothetical protein
MLVLTILAFGHVPSYPPYRDNCAGIHKKGPEQSQVAYLRGTGGIEFHLESDTDPVDTINGQNIDFDVILRDEVDLTSFALYIGCGGCMEMDELAPRVFDSEYQTAHVEPFTQTQIRSIVAKSARKFNSSLLRSSVCTHQHFTIRIVDFQNRSDGRPLVWSPVIGLKEEFDVHELAYFPLYILANHGAAWNELAWTYPLCLFLLAPLFIFLWRLNSTVALNSNPIQLVREHGRTALPAITVCRVDPRESLYDIAIHAFVAAALEELLHLMVAQYGIAIGYQFFVGLLLISVSQCLPILFVVFVWHVLLHSRNECVQQTTNSRTARAWRACMNWSSSADAWWGIGELIVAFVVGMFLFGAGFYIGPFAIAIAAILKLVRICIPRRSTTSVLVDGPLNRICEPIRALCAAPPLTMLKA